MRCLQAQQRLTSASEAKVTMPIETNFKKWLCHFSIEAETYETFLLAGNEILCWWTGHEGKMRIVSSNHPILPVGLEMLNAKACCSKGCASLAQILVFNFKRVLQKRLCAEIQRSSKPFGKQFGLFRLSFLVKKSQHGHTQLSNPQIPSLHLH